MKAVLIGGDAHLEEFELPTPPPPTFLWPKPVPPELLWPRNPPPREACFEVETYERVDCPYTGETREVGGYVLYAVRSS